MTALNAIPGEYIVMTPTPEIRALRKHCGGRGVHGDARSSVLGMLRLRFSLALAKSGVG
jgi:hypothetical protein